MAGPQPNQLDYTGQFGVSNFNNAQGAYQQQYQQAQVQNQAQQAMLKAMRGI
jgi:hypothetical protein